MMIASVLMTAARGRVHEDRVKDRAATGLPANGGTDFVERIIKNLRAPARSLRSAKLEGPFVLDPG
jgi:hypothetical protein